MSELVADLHLHSRFSRAVSKNMVTPVMAEAAKRKGIDVLATGDFTHPQWFTHLEETLVETERGVYTVKGKETAAKYLLGTEIACIFTQGGKGRRIHTLVFAPSLEVVGKINQALLKRGCNLKSDGRPILPLSLIELSDLLFSIDDSVEIIPAHVWTPWFGMLGSASGFNSMRECFGDNAEKIHAVETGLSSNPEMNWRIPEFECCSVVSFSDAHSPDKLGRELTVLTNEGAKTKETPFTYQDFRYALQNQGNWKIGYTIEFYPEEGKYHVDGHRACNVWQEPSETRERGRLCPVCGKPLTLGVLGRVEQLAGKDIVPMKKTTPAGLTMYFPQNPFHKPYLMLVPLREIIAESVGKGINTKTVGQLYDKLLEHFGSELTILTKARPEDISAVTTQKIGEGIDKVRTGDISIRPGFDGVFGEVKIWGSKTDLPQNKDKQMTLF